MSIFGQTKLPQPPQNPMGIETYKASTNEQARPVPYLCGTQRFAATFISDIFDQNVVAYTQGSGKTASTQGYQYYASFAALFCGGPVDAISDIFLNGESVYASDVVVTVATLAQTASVATVTTYNPHGFATGNSILINGAEQLEYNGTFTITVTGANTFTYVLSGSPTSPATVPNNQSYITAQVHLAPITRGGSNPDYVDITIPTYGVMRLYWGTDTQNPDTYLNSGPFQHPAYRGICYAVFNQLYLGYNQTNVQNIEIVLSRYPTQTWLTAQNINNDTSLVAFFADMLQHPRFGLGLADSQMDTTTLLAVNTTLVNEGSGFSPIISREQEFSQLLATAMEYVDAYPLFNTDGTVGMGLVRAPTGSIPAVADADLIEKPEFSQTDWTSVFNETFVQFTNRLLQYTADQVGRPDCGTRSITGFPNSQTLDRSWVTDANIANALMQSSSLASALPKISGTLKLHKNATLFAALLPGQPFTLSYSKRNTANIVFRVDERTVDDPSKPEFTVTFHADRSYVY